MTHVRIGVILPEVLGTYADGGNALVLAERVRRRGMSAEIVSVNVGDPIPDDLDVYTLGGGEDAAQEIAVDMFRHDRGLLRAIDAGRTVLAICASLQILGHWYADANGHQVEGLGVLDVTTSPQGKRSIGEILVEPTIPGLTDPLTGFINHGGGTVLGADARPLGHVRAGVGNTIGRSGVTDTAGQDISVDGAVHGSVVATYMHGPVLARNPQLADFLLEQALGYPLDALEIPGGAELRSERLAAMRER